MSISSDAHPYLLVDRHPLQNKLTYNSLPVFPAPSEHIFKSLQELADMAKCQLKEVTGQIGKLKTTREEVVALGQTATSSAQLYAHLTQRVYKAIDDISLLTEIPSVIVTTSDKLNAQLMNVLYSSTYKTCGPGIICGSSADDLFKQSIIRAAAVSLNNFLISKNSIELYPTSSLAEKQFSGRIILGSKSQGSRVRRALQNGAEMITVLSHGDGVDALLHPKLTLCSRRTPPRSAKLTKSPYCVETGHCFRHNVSVTDALETPKLISPREIKTRILNLCVCHGVLCPEGEIDPQWGYLHQFLDSNTLGSLVTSWSVVSASPKMLKTFTDSIYEGKTVGYAIARLNRSTLAKESNVKFCLFGDPSIKIHDTAVKITQLKSSARRSNNKRREEQADLNGIIFLRLYLTNALFKCSGKLLDLAQHSLNLVNLYEAAANQGYKIEDSNDSIGKRMRLSVLEFLYMRGTVISHDWINFVKSRKIISETSCFNCGTQTETTICKFGKLQIPPRRIQICPRCSIIEDVPLVSDLKLSVKNGGTFLLSGKLPSENWTAGLRLGCQNDPESHGYLWTSDNNNAPSRNFKPPARWPAGPLKVGFILMENASIGIVSVPGRWNSAWKDETNIP